MMRRRFVRHPRGYAGDRPVGLRNYDQLETAVGVFPDDEHVLAATGMELVVNPPFDRVFAGSMSMLRAAPESRECPCRAQADGSRSCGEAYAERAFYAAPLLSLPA